MQIITKPGASQMIEITMRSSTTGQFLTGLAHTDITCYYQRQGAAAPVSVSMSAGLAGTWSSGGWVEVDSVTNPGVYQFGVPNAALAAGVNQVILTFTATGALDKLVEIALTMFDLQTASVTLADDAITAAKIDASAITEIQSGLSTLTQADILSDATPFAGANIDTTIGSRSDFDETTDPVTVGDLETAALAQFANTDTGEVAAVAGSVAELSQCNAIGFPAGSISFEYTVLSSVTGLPVGNVAVWISTDNPADGNPTNVIWSGFSDTFGVARDVQGNQPMLDAGTYYFWREAPGYSFTNPDTEIVSNP